MRVNIWIACLLPGGLNRTRSSHRSKDSKSKKERNLIDFSRQQLIGLISISATSQPQHSNLLMYNEIAQ